MNDRFFTMGIFLFFITLSVNSMLTMGAQLQDTNGDYLAKYMVPYYDASLSTSLRTKTADCNISATQLTPQSTAPGSTEGFTPYTCKDSGSLDVAAGISFLTNGVLMLLGLELVLSNIGTFLFPPLSPIFLGLAAIVALLKWGVIAYAASQIVRALFGRSFF
jgi:hypothetical protein